MFENKASLPAKFAVEYNKSGKECRFIDVREIYEYKYQHFNGALNIPLSLIPSCDNILQNKNEILFIYCKSGARSGEACRFLREKGYCNAFNIGGLADLLVAI